MNDENKGVDIAEAFQQVVIQRRAVRGYLPQTIPMQTLTAVFDTAKRAPSNCNTQPWQVYVASGKALAHLKTRLVDHGSRWELKMDFVYDMGQYEGVYKEREIAAARALLAAMGIEREDKAGRDALIRSNFECYGAPYAAFLFLPEQFSIREAADLGMYAQTLMLALTSHGIACCPQTSLSLHADCVRQVLGIESCNKLLFGISFGYEDTSVPANQCRTERASLAESVHFVSEPVAR